MERVRSGVGVTFLVCAVFCAGVAVTAESHISAAFKTPGLSMQFDAEGKALEADRNARALRTIEVGAYAGLYQLTGVINFSKSRTSDLATAGIDLHAAKSTALDILELNKALQKAGFNYLSDYIRVTSAPNGDMWRNDAVDRARSKISGLVADDLANLDRAMIFVFQNAGDNELMVAQSLQ